MKQIKLLSVSLVLIYIASVVWNLIADFILHNIPKDVWYRSSVEVAFVIPYITMIVAFLVNAVFICISIVSDWDDVVEHFSNIKIFGKAKKTENN